MKKISEEDLSRPAVEVKIPQVERKKKRPALTRFVLPYTRVSGTEAGAFRAFFNSQRGQFDSTWSFTLGSITYANLTFEDRSFTQREDPAWPTLFAFTLRARQTQNPGMAAGSPVSVNASMSTGGGYSDMDRFGNVRDSTLSPFPNVSQGFFDYRNNVTVPGRTNSQFGGQGGTTIVLMPGAIQAIDAKSIIDRHADIADAVAKSFQLGSSVALAETMSSRGA